MAIVGLSKIRSALDNGVPLQTILTPPQYDAYLMLQKMRAAAAATYDPSKPLPNILKLVPPPTKAKTNNKRKRPRQVATLAARPLPQECRDVVAKKGVVLDDGNLKLIFVRRLFHTDVSDHHKRLAMPIKQVREEFLTAEEKELLVDYGRNLSVRVIEPSLEEKTMCLAKWNKEAAPGKSWWFALTSDWMVFVRDNKLAVGDVIQVWSFRVQGQLCFLIHKTESAPATHDVHNGDDDVVMRWATKKRRGDNRNHRTAAIN